MKFTFDPSIQNIANPPDILNELLDNPLTSEPFTQAQITWVSAPGSTQAPRLHQFIREPLNTRTRALWNSILLENSGAGGKQRMDHLIVQIAVDKNHPLHNTSLSALKEKGRVPRVHGEKPKQQQAEHLTPEFEDELRALFRTHEQARQRPSTEDYFRHLVHINKVTIDNLGRPNITMTTLRRRLTAFRDQSCLTQVNAHAVPVASHPAQSSKRKYSQIDDGPTGACETRHHRSSSSNAQDKAVAPSPQIIDLVTPTSSPNPVSNAHRDWNVPNSNQLLSDIEDPDLAEYLANYPGFKQLPI